MSENLFDLLTKADPARPSFVDTTNNGVTTYGDLKSRALQFATALDQFGLRPGDRIAVQTSKSIDAYAIWLGCLAKGFIYVPTNTAYTSSELSYLCSDAKAQMLVAQDPTVLAELERSKSISFAEVAACADSCPPAAHPSTAIDLVPGQHPAALVYTSGTTGQPKGAALTHASIAENAKALANVWEFKPDDILVHSLPLYHIHGLLISLNPALLVGATVRLVPRFEVGPVIEALEGATVFMGVPTYYLRLLGTKRFGATNCSTMRLFTSGSAPMTELTHAEFHQRTGHQIVERYGMSEAGIITSNRIGAVVAGSVGYPLPGYEVRLVDGQSRPVENTDTGTVQIRGASLFASYWCRPNDKSVDPHGWFSTGDVGTFDTSGRLFLQGRSSDMIISGGLNIYPKEIELAIDQIEGVVESAVVGMPDDDFGEAVTAFVVCEPGIGLDNLSLSTALENLARFKHPKATYQIDQLPRNAMGKVQKALLRQRC